MVTLSGPTAVAPSSTNDYRLQIAHSGALQTHGGLNVSAAMGLLSTGGSDSANTQVLSGEITHTAPKAAVGGMTTFTFRWTAPASFTNVSLNAWGNSVNNDGDNSGDRATFHQLTILNNPAPTSTPTPTSTPAPPSPTPTPTSTPTSTPTGPPPMPTSGCTGDCDGDASITIDELLQGVNIALGSVGLEQCPSFDSNNDGFVTIDEVLQAVHGALDGCPVAPSPTATPTPTRPSPTATTAGAALRNIQVAFKLERGGTFGGPLWVSPLTYTQVGQGPECTVEARANGIDTAGRPVEVSAAWTASDPNMVTVSPPQGHQVSITVHGAGQSTVQVSAGGVSTELSIKATPYLDVTLLVNITIH